MENKLKEYLKYYIGCECQGTFIWNTKFKSHLDGSWVDRLIFYNKPLHKIFKPILRKLSSITVEEKIEFYEISIGEKADFKNILFIKTIVNHNIIDNKIFNSTQFHWLIEHKFWIFGDEYFDEGFIVEKQ